MERLYTGALLFILQQTQWGALVMHSKICVNLPLLRLL